MNSSEEVIQAEYVAFISNVKILNSQSLLECHTLPPEEDNSAKAKSQLPLMACISINSSSLGMSISIPVFNKFKKTSDCFDVIADKILMGNVGVRLCNICDIGANGVMLFLTRTQFHYLQGKI